MALLVDGKWQDSGYDTKGSDGEFVRAQSQWRDWVTVDGAPAEGRKRGFKAEPGRYHLYVSLACPWAHRTLILRALKKLEDVISVSVVHHFMGANGWTFLAEDGATGDTLYGFDFLHQIYTKADPAYSGRVTVPVLWDRREQTIVSNESSEIIRMLNSAFDKWGDASLDFYPKALRGEIDAVNALVYQSVNNGVYRAGFATTQTAYEKAFGELFSALDQLEDRLSRRRYLVGDRNHRGRLAAVHHAGPLRSGLCRPFQVQPAPHRRLSESVELSARPLSGPRRRRHGEPVPHQGALLWQPRSDQPDAHRAGRAGTGPRGAA